MGKKRRQSFAYIHYLEAKYPSTPKTKTSRLNHMKCNGGRKTVIGSLLINIWIVIACKILRGVSELLMYGSV